MTAAKKPPARALAHCVYYTDEDGRLTIYQPGDVPAPEHAAQIGDHAFTPAEEWSPAAADLAVALRGGVAGAGPELTQTPAPPAGGD